MKFLLQRVVVGFTLALLVSCGPKPGMDISKVIEAAQVLANQGQVDKALSSLERYYKSDAYTSARLPLLAALIQLEQTAGRGDAAQARFMKAAVAEPVTAQQYLGTLLKNRDWVAAEVLLVKIETGLAGLPAWPMPAANARVDLILGRDGYKVAQAHVTKVLKGLDDESASRNVRLVGDAALAAGDLAAADAFFEAVLSGGNGAKSREAAGGGWLRVSVRRGAAPEVMARLERLQNDGLAPSFMLLQISDAYPVLLGRGNQDIFKRIFALCEKLEAMPLSGDNRYLLGGMMLDVSYYLGDFELALKLIEKGAIPIEGDQKLQMIAKVHAHIEMKRGQPREAVKYLREFMGYIAKLQRMESDPVNNCTISSTMILGLNAKRIGDLLMSAGDKDEARKAYEEARVYYGKALNEFPDVKSRENRKIIREMSEIPAP